MSSKAEFGPGDPWCVRVDRVEFGSVRVPDGKRNDEGKPLRILVLECGHMQMAAPQWGKVPAFVFCCECERAADGEGGV